MMYFRPLDPEGDPDALPGLMEDALFVCFALFIARCLEILAGRNAVKPRPGA